MKTAVQSLVLGANQISNYVQQNVSEQLFKKNRKVDNDYGLHFTSLKKTQ